MDKISSSWTFDCIHTHTFAKTTNTIFIQDLFFVDLPKSNEINIYEYTSNIYPNLIQQQQQNNSAGPIQ